ncbi:unnamed protein product, partial [Linum tenue]
HPHQLPPPEINVVQPQPAPARETYPTSSSCSSTMLLCPRLRQQSRPSPPLNLAHELVVGPLRYGIHQQLH